MKELSTEEKAKLYDKIIEFAYNKHRFSSNLSEIKLIEEMFPELYESEDERIRKEIINYFKCQSRDEPRRKNIHNKWINWLNCIKISSIDNTDNSFIDDIKNIIYEAPKVLQADKNRLITWLENQGKPQIRTDINWESVIDDACKWLKENTYLYVNDYTGSLNEDKLIEDFRKNYMKGE